MTLNAAQNSTLKETTCEPRGARWFGLHSFFQGSRALLWLVALVVVLVSLPLLRSVALKENEVDALRALNLLGPQVFAADAQVEDFRTLLEPESELGRRLPDSRLVDGGRVMFRHGYLFEIVPLEDGQRLLRAWPLDHGKSGLGAFWANADGQVLGHPNGAAQWSGMDAAPYLPAHDGAGLYEGGWKPLALSSHQTRAGI